MADVKSDQLTPTDVVTGFRRGKTTEEHGKLRHAYFNFKNTTGAALPAGSTIDLCKLPTGNVRILPQLSMVKTSAMTGASMSVGLRAYSRAANEDLVAESATELRAATSVNAAANGALSTNVKQDYYSRSGITVFSTVTVAEIPVDATVEGYLTYVYD